MRIEILGSAAGGGFPQWNCACRNCRSLRAGKFHGKTRAQLQVAISSDGVSWFLLNASPDLRSLIEAFPFLHPREGLRQSPIAGVILTSADLDQILGLLLLRELQPLQVYATGSVSSIARQDNSMFNMLQRVPNQVRWNEIIPGTSFPLATPGDKSIPIQCLTVPLTAHYPAYVTVERVAKLKPQEALIGLILQSESGERFGYFPAVPELDDALLQQLDSLDLLMFDGTFWSDDELIQVQGSGQTAKQMGHIPVSSQQGSLHLLAGLRCPKKIFVHINNTNPMLDESGPEFKQVRDAGWEIAEDGCHFEL
ncbi:MAG: pyrroloquinoline quinone biosynthesis protein PqqB [Terriglobales bacterium]